MKRTILLIPYRWHASAYFILIILWTVALLSTIPTRQSQGWDWTPDARFYFSKLVHVCAYLVLTILGLTLFTSKKSQLILLFFLCCHGAVTEYFQQFTGRTGSVRDVFLDYLGIITGYLFTPLFIRYWHTLFQSSQAAPKP